MARTERYTAQQIIDVLRETKGMVHLASDKLGCSHTTIYNYIKRYATVEKEFRHQRGLLLDAAEMRLGTAVYDGEAWAIRFTLSMLGADRGYASKSNIQHSGEGDDGELVVTFKGNVDASKL